MNTNEVGHCFINIVLARTTNTKNANRFIFMNLEISVEYFM